MINKVIKNFNFGEELDTNFFNFVFALKLRNLLIN